MTEEKNELVESMENKLAELPEDNPVKKLDGKKRAFLLNYMNSGYNHAKAGKMAGITRGSLPWILKDPLFQEAVIYLQGLERHELTISKQHIIDTYKDTLEKAVEKDDIAGINRTLEGLSKLMGYQAPTENIQTVKGKIEHDHVHTSDLEDKLQARLEQMHSEAITVQPKYVGGDKETS